MGVSLRHMAVSGKRCRAERLATLVRFLVLSGSDERKDGGRLDFGSGEVVFFKDGCARAGENGDRLDLGGRKLLFSERKRCDGIE